MYTNCPKKILCKSWDDNSIFLGGNVLTNAGLCTDWLHDFFVGGNNGFMLVTMLLVKIQSLIFVIYMFAGHMHL